MKANRFLTASCCSSFNRLRTSHIVRLPIKFATDVVTDRLFFLKSVIPSRYFLNMALWSQDVSERQVAGVCIHLSKILDVSQRELIIDRLHSAWRHVRNTVDSGNWMGCDVFTMSFSISSNFISTCPHIKGEDREDTIEVPSFLWVSDSDV